MLGRFLALSLLSVLPLACTSVLQGEPVDLAVVATPTPQAPAERHELPTLTPGLPAPPPAGSFRAWVPREVTANGDVIDGHYLLISATPPPAERLEPPVPMPRIPKPTRAKPKPQSKPLPQAPPPAEGMPGPVRPEGQPPLPFLWGDRVQLPPNLHGPVPVPTPQLEGGR